MLSHRFIALISTMLFVDCIPVSVSGAPFTSHSRALGISVSNNQAASQIDSFSSSLGVMPQILWANIDHRDWKSATYSLNGQFSSPTSAVSYALHNRIAVLWTVPIVTEGENLRDASEGAYDAYYVALAKRLIKSFGASDAIYIRPGNELNGYWMPWSPKKGQEVLYATSFRRLVVAFRSVSQNFKFEWNVAVGWASGIDPLAAYPGDDCVDYIGGDVYYNSRRGNDKDVNRYIASIAGPRNFQLGWLSSFAEMHNKPLALSEWGTEDDSPAFVNFVADWIKSHKVAYQIYWNRDDDQAMRAELQNSFHSRAIEAFKSQFSNGK